MKYLTLILLSVTCMAARGDLEIALEDLRIEIGDLKRAHRNYRSELDIMDEKINRQRSKGSANEVRQALEDRIGSLELRLGRIEDLLQSLQGSTDDQISALKNAMQSVVKLAEHRSGKSYTVKSGDSLDKIARREGSSVRKIKQANELSSDVIFPGQVLLIPS